METEIKIIAVYVVGFIVSPFVFSLMEGWPLFKPRQDGEDAFFAIATTVFWPVFAVVYLGYTWWCGSSWLGSRLREAVAGLFRRLTERKKKGGQTRPPTAFTPKT